MLSTVGLLGLAVDVLKLNGEGSFFTFSIIQRVVFTVLSYTILVDFQTYSQCLFSKFTFSTEQLITFL